MNLYNEYGVLPMEVQDKLFDLEKKVFPMFLEIFPDLTITELRILFREFLDGLHGRVSEEILFRAIKQKKSSRDANWVRVNKFQKAEDSIVFIPIDDSEIEPASNPVELDPKLEEGDLLSDNPNEDEGDK